MKHAFRIAAHDAAPHARNIYPLAASNRIAALLRDGASQVRDGASKSARPLPPRSVPQADAGFSSLVQDFLDECGYSDK